MRVGRRSTRSCMSAMRSVVSGCVRRYEGAPLNSFRRLARSRRSKKVTMPRVSKPGALEQREADAVGLALVVARVVELRLHRPSRWRPSTAASVTWPLWPPPLREARMATASAASEAICVPRWPCMARAWWRCGDVRDLVREHAGQLGLVLRERDEAACTRRCARRRARRR